MTELALFFIYLVISPLVWQAAFMVFSASPRQRIKDLTKYQIDKMEQMMGQDHFCKLGWELKRGIDQPWTEAEVSKGSSSNKW